MKSHMRTIVSLATFSLLIAFATQNSLAQTAPSNAPATAAAAKPAKPKIDDKKTKENREKLIKQIKLIEKKQQAKDPANPFTNSDQALLNMIKQVEKLTKDRSDLKKFTKGKDKDKLTQPEKDKLKELNKAIDSSKKELDKLKDEYKKIKKGPDADKPAEEKGVKEEPKTDKSAEDKKVTEGANDDKSAKVSVISENILRFTTDNDEASDEDLFSEDLLFGDIEEGDSYNPADPLDESERLNQELAREELAIITALIEGDDESESQIETDRAQDQKKMDDLGDQLY